MNSAAARAVSRAIKDAAPAIMQPIMKAVVSAPEANLGAVLGELQTRHALIQDTEHTLDSVNVHCEVALADFLGFTTTLRSLTQGRGVFSTKPNCSGSWC